MEEIQEKIDKIKMERAVYNLVIPEPITETDAFAFKEKFSSVFETMVDDVYLDFLMICNGLEENGFQIYASKNHEKEGVLYGIFENNEIWHEEIEDFKNYIFYAESGQDLFVFNKSDKVYQLLDRSSGDVFESFNSLGQMLVYILIAMLNEDED